MVYPKRFGLPCWEKDQADKCINIVAQVSKEKAPLFLATHTPIQDILDNKSGSIVSEEQAFKNIFSRKGEIRVVVRGGPGTGKSHLIRWINLRTEYASKHEESELSRFKIVMVQRETGSLKAALKQIVDQLGDEFGQYIEDIKNSVDKFSEETIREELISEVALEINSRWEQRGHDPLPSDLKQLGDVLLSPGCRQWFGRDGGVIARKISRLTDRSTQEDRKKIIVFDETELKPSPQYLSREQDAQSVHNFFEHIEYEDDIAEDAVEVLNIALEEAQRELTGIKGAKLNEIFTAIRRKLKQQKKELAIFIEDVTAASGGLDFDLFQAFEPREGKDLCRMIALLGMTNEGWNVLPDNEKDRVNFDFDIGNNAFEWSKDTEKVAQFAARYLNAIRCTENDINILAQDRFSSDVSMSKCYECPHKDDCHKTFGFVELEENIKIGLFPFSQAAPQNLLDKLNETHYRSSPRGLLDAVMDGALVKSYNHFQQNKFPSPVHFSVRREAINYWTEFENRYLGGGGWADRAKKEQIQFLSEFWLNTTSSNEIASKIELFRQPFSLPEFSVKPQKTRTEPSKKEKNKSQTKHRPKDIKENKNLNEQLTLLANWSRGDGLKKDSEFRRYLLSLIKKAILFQDHQVISIQFVKAMIPNINPIYIHGQVSKRKNQLFLIEFDRSDETHHVLEDLTRYNVEGKKSWDFNNGEFHKRRVFKWVRKNEKKIISSFDPNPPSLKNDVIKSASQVLAFSAILKNRSFLPIRDIEKRISMIFNPNWDSNSRPQVLSNSLKRFVEDIENKWEETQRLILNELGVGQGTSNPKSFINPLPILNALKNFEKNPTIEVPSGKINESFWKKRFDAVANLNAYKELNIAIDDEKKELERFILDIKNFLIDLEFNGKELKKELTDCINEIIETVELQKQKITYPNENFDLLWRSKRIQENKREWGSDLSKAVKIVNDNKNIDILCFDASSIKNAWNDLTIVTKDHLKEIEIYLDEQEKPDEESQGGTKEDFLKVLDNIITVLDQGNTK